jgi:hypothetical protein
MIQANSSSVDHLCTSQPKSSVAPLPHRSKFKSSATNSPDMSKFYSSSAVPRSSKKKNTHHQPNFTPLPWYCALLSSEDVVPTAPQEPLPPSRPFLFTDNNTINTPANLAPMLPSQVSIWYPNAPFLIELSSNLGAHPSRPLTTTQHRQAKIIKTAEKDSRNMSKLPRPTYTTNLDNTY